MHLDSMNVKLDERMDVVLSLCSFPGSDPKPKPLNLQKCSPHHDATAPSVSVSPCFWDIFLKRRAFSPSVCLEGTTAGSRTSNCVWLGRTGMLTHADTLRCTHTNTRTLISSSTGIVQERADIYTQTPRMQVLRMSDPANFFFCLFVCLLEIYFTV